MGQAESQSKIGSTSELTDVEARLVEIKTALDDIELKIDAVKTDGAIRVITV